MRLFARMDADRHGLILRDDDETTAEGPQIAGEGGRFGPEWGAGREPHGGSGYAPVDTGHFHCAVAKRLMVQSGHEKASQPPMPRALSRKEPAEHRIVIEGAGEHLSGLRRISTPGHPYLKTSHAHQRRPRRISRHAWETKDRLPQDARVHDTIGKLAELLAHTG